MGPPFMDGESAYFLGINRNKRSVTLDLRHDTGRALFFELVRVSDVVIDNFRAGVTTRLGIDHEGCQSVKPDIITCAVTGFGEHGPYRDLPAFDLILQAMGGAMSLTGEKGRAPVRMGIPMGDLAGGLLAALAVVGAVVRRDRTGEGQHIDIGLLDAQVSLLTYIAQYWFADGRVPGPSGTEHQSVVPYQVFETATSPIVVAVFVDRHWPPFCDALGCPGLVDKYDTNLKRHAAREELVASLERRFLTRGADDWLLALRAAGVPCGPVNTVDLALQDPHVMHRNMVVESSDPHPRIGRHRLIGDPIKVDGDDDLTFRPAPLLGEHNEAVLGGVLGHSARELEAWRALGVIGGEAKTSPESATGS
jgi:crotonobetainyl-CoA:carnitine CoA-transferase CaiB-like acyl-CoA transferase